MCPLNVDLLSVTFDPETAEIRSVIYDQCFIQTSCFGGNRQHWGRRWGLRALPQRGTEELLVRESGGQAPRSFLLHKYLIFVSKVLWKCSSFIVFYVQ